MITKEQKEIIKKYVPGRYYDKEKLLGYLKIHDIVGNELFEYVDKHNEEYGEDRPAHSRYLDDKSGYRPLPVDVFIRRVPFYFHKGVISEGKLGELHFLLSDLNRSDSPFREYPTKEELEAFYLDLEFMYYDLNIEVDSIFNYMLNQTGGYTIWFSRWVDYLKICKELGWTDYMPKSFVTAYNHALEEIGREPIRYSYEDAFGDHFSRSGNILEFWGTFPQEDGYPIMEWTNLEIKNAESITCSCRKSESGRLRVEIKPDTVIWANNPFEREDEEDQWYQIYAGPKTMEFDYTILKERRKRLKYTQKDVADAVGATVRTYQKWENGETTPDGHYLLRLMNWLDIGSIQSMVKYLVE